VASGIKKTSGREWKINGPSVALNAIIVSNRAGTAGTEAGGNKDMSSKELNLTKKVSLCRLRRVPDCKVIKTVGGPYQERGVSDLLLCWHGRYVAIELKEPGRFEDGYCLAERFKPTSPTETANNNSYCR
jgi:hypothetical protein